MLICIFFVCFALLTNPRTTVDNNADKDRDLNKKKKVIVGATLSCILLSAALLISYIIIKQERKRLKNEQLLMDDQIEAYSTSPLTTDNIIFHGDIEELL